MRRNYTIAGLKSVAKNPSLDVVQFTINGRQYPGTRRTVEHLKDLRATGNTTDVIVHWDFIYIVSRYVMFNENLKDRIISELAELINYAESDSHVLGIVMHTDWPIKKDFLKAIDKAQFINDNYSGGIWNTSFIKWVVEGSEIQNLLTKSITVFAEDLLARLGFAPRCKVYLENTTKVGPNGEGSLQWITTLFSLYPWIKEVLGIVYDTEHHFAVTGEWLDVDEIKSLKHVTDVIVHLNTIPKEVKPKSGKDRHSETTVTECSYNTKEYYEEYSKNLDDLGIPWVREVKEEAMLRELEQLWNQK